MNNVLLMGGMGSIGRRYASILKHLHVPHSIYDRQIHPDPPQKGKHTHVIVATPTNTHVEVLRDLKEWGLPILCEKPLSRSLLECEEVARWFSGKPCYLVNNYWFLVKKYLNGKGVSLHYDYYYTGKDGMYWDLAQVLMIDPTADLWRRSPTWHFRVNHSWIPYKELERSYVKMMEAFLGRKNPHLWHISRGVEMTEKVLERIERDENTRRNSGEVKLDPVSSQDL